MSVVPEAVRNRGEEAVRIYRRCLRRGGSERLAEMLALRAPPAGRTEDEMLAELQRLNPLTDKSWKMLAENARKYGYHPNTSDVYVPTLVPPGESPGHPDAWLSHKEGGRAKMRRVLEKRGVECEDWVKTKARDVPPPKPGPRLAKDIQESLYREYISSDPGLARKDKREVLESIIETHAFKGESDVAKSD